MRVLFDCFAVSKRRNEKEIDMQNATSLTVMTVQQAAEYLGLAVSTLNKWRCLGDGPAFMKMGRAVRYRITDLDQFMIDTMSVSTSC